MASSTPTDTRAPTERRSPDGARRCALLVFVPSRLQDPLSSVAQMADLQPLVAATAESLRDALYDEDVAVALVHFGRDVPSGIATCRTIRRHAAGRDLPLIALLDPAAASQYPVDSPADDVLTVPPAAEEALLRIRLAVWRRDDSGDEALIRIGDVTIDTVGLHVREKGVPADLTYKEFALLSHFARNPGVALTRDSILAAVWGDEYYGGDRTVDIHVRRLRAKLPTIQDRIETVHGVGYRLSAGRAREDGTA